MPSVGRWVVLACLILGCGARTELHPPSHPAPGLDGGVVTDSLVPADAEEDAPFARDVPPADVPVADVVERTDVTAREHGRVVFLRGAVTGQGGVFVVGIDGTGERQLVPPPPMGTYLSVARTVDSRGRVIVRAANACAFPCGPTAPPRLFAVDPDTAAATTLIEDPGQPGLAAVLRGDRVVYSMGHGPDELGVVTPDGASRVRLARHGRLLGEAPDGRVLWLDRDSSELVLGAPDGSSRTVVATGVPASSVGGNNTAQLADGRIAFRGRPAGGGAPGLYLARADGSSPTLLLTGAGRVAAVLPGGRVVLQVLDSPGVQVIDPARPGVPLARFDTLVFAALTASGRLVMNRYPTDATSPHVELWTARPDGGELLRVSSGGFFLLSSPDAWLVYRPWPVSTTTDDLSVVPERGGRTAMLTTTGDAHQHGLVGSALLYFQNSPAGTSVHVAALDGSRDRVLVSGSGFREFDALLPDGRILFGEARPDDRPGVASELRVMNPDGSRLVVLGGASPLRQTFGVYLP